MPTHTGSRRPPKNNNNNNNNTGNDFKTLKTLYRQQLPTLRELFPGWSQEDLVAAMHEANGDLDLTIGRIMEGHANQWDQVKVKKTKPPQKQQTTNNTTKKTEGLNGTRDVSQSSKGKNGRPRGKFGHKVQRNKKDNEETPKPVEKEEEKKPSWASILKGPTKPEPPVELSKLTSPDTSITPTINDHSEKVMEPDGNDECNDDENVDKIQESLTDQVNLIVEEEETVDAAEQLKDDGEQQDDTMELNDKNEELTLSTESLDTPTLTDSQEPQQMMAFRKVPVRRLKQDEPVVLPGGASGLENVSLQFGSLNLSNGEEQQPQPIEEDKQEENEPEPQPEHQQVEEEKDNSTPDVPPSAPQAPTNAPTANTTQPISSSTTTAVPVSPQVSSNLANSTKASDTTVYHQPQPQQQQPQMQQQPQTQQTQMPQPQIQQYQQNFQPQHSVLPSSDAHINPYAQYAPNAIPTNGQFQGFTDPGMVTVPDYYNSDAQRPMNYYDSSIYNQSPSVGNANLYGRGKFNNMQEGMTPSPTSLGMMGNHSSTPVMQAPQQLQAGMYSGNAGNYYSYYYLPGQYQGYQQAGYQQSVPQQYQPPQQFQHPQQGQPSQQIPQQPQPQQVPQQTQTQQPQQVQQSQQAQPPQSQKPPQTSYMNPNTYPMYGKQNNTVFQDYTTPQSYDDSMLHSNGAQGLMYDKQYQSPNNGLPQMQQYLGGNMNSQQQNQNQQQPSGMVNGQPKDTMMNGFDKQGQPMHQQPVLNQGSYQPHYQQYNHHQPQYQQQQQQQPFLYQQQPYNPSVPNNTMNSYPARQQPNQQNPYWHQA